MSANEWAGYVLSVLGILTAVFKILQYIIRHENKTLTPDEIREIVREEVYVMKHELTNNGGSSTKDKIDYIFKHIKESNGNNG